MPGVREFSMSLILVIVSDCAWPLSVSSSHLGVRLRLRVRALTSDSRPRPSHTVAWSYRFAGDSCSCEPCWLLSFGFGELILKPCVMLLSVMIKPCSLQIRYVLARL